jgi:hypothetical protein
MSYSAATCLISHSSRCARVCLGSPLLSSSGRCVGCCVLGAFPVRRSSCMRAFALRSVHVPASAPATSRSGASVRGNVGTVFKAPACVLVCGTHRLEHIVRRANVSSLPASKSLGIGGIEPPSTASQADTLTPVLYPPSCVLCPIHMSSKYRHYFDFRSNNAAANGPPRDRIETRGGEGEGEQHITAHRPINSTPIDTTSRSEFEPATTRTHAHATQGSTRTHASTVSKRREERPPRRGDRKAQGAARKLGGEGQRRRSTRSRCACEVDRP